MVKPMTTVTRCHYCGRENEQSIAACPGCGTAFETALPAPRSLSLPRSTRIRITIASFWTVALLMVVRAIQFPAAWGTALFLALTLWLLRCFIPFATRRLKRTFYYSLAASIIVALGSNVHPWSGILYNVLLILGAFPVALVFVSLVRSDGIVFRRHASRA
jgi:hypothetical protein